VNSQNHDDVGVIFSLNTKAGKKSSSSSPQNVVKRKGGSYLCYYVHSLKRIARFPDKDRKEVLRALRRTVKKRRMASEVSKTKVISYDGSAQSDSQSLVNNDWSNWVVLHGNDKVAVDDIWRIGKVVGLKFNGDKNNMFNVLSRAGIGKKEGGVGREGVVLGGGELRCCVVVMKIIS